MDCSIFVGSCVLEASVGLASVGTISVDMPTDNKTMVRKKVVNNAHIPPTVHNTLPTLNSYATDC